MISMRVSHLGAIFIASEYSWFWNTAGELVKPTRRQMRMWENVANLLGHG